MGQRQDLLLNVVVGIIGAFVAGFLLALLSGISTINQNNLSFPAMLASVAGAAILLFVVSLFRQSRRFRLS